MTRHLLREQLCGIYLRRTSQNGFTLLYVIFIIAILVLIVAGSVTAVLAQRRMALNSEAQKQAQYLAESAALALNAELHAIMEEPTAWVCLMESAVNQPEVAMDLKVKLPPELFASNGAIVKQTLTMSGNQLTINVDAVVQKARYRYHTVALQTPFFAGALATTGDIQWQNGYTLPYPVSAGGRITGLLSSSKWQEACFAPPYWQESLVVDASPITAVDDLDLGTAAKGASQVTCEQDIVVHGEIQNDVLLLFPPGIRVTLGEITGKNEAILGIIADDIATSASGDYDGISMLLIAQKELYLAHHGKAEGVFLCLGNKSAKIIVEKGADIVYSPFPLSWLKSVGFIADDKIIRVYSDGSLSD